MIRPLALALLLAAPALGQSPVRPSPQSVTPAPAPAVAVAPAAPAWLSWLNGQRAARGLRPLVENPALDADAYRNSSIGYGHFTRNFGRGQVVGWGPLGTVEALWLGDRPHYVILMDPYATQAGFGSSGLVSTIDIY